MGLAQGRNSLARRFLETPKPHKKGPTPPTDPLKAPRKYGVGVGRHQLGGLERPTHKLRWWTCTLGTEKVLNKCFLNE